MGCGAGLVTEPISCLGAAVIGIDAAERNVLIAERHARSTGACVEYRHALPEDLADQLVRFGVDRGCALSTSHYCAQVS